MRRWRRPPPPAIVFTRPFLDTSRTPHSAPSPLRGGSAASVFWIHLRPRRCTNRRAPKAPRASAGGGPPAKATKTITFAYSNSPSKIDTGPVLRPESGRHRESSVATFLTLVGRCADDSPLVPTHRPTRPIALKERLRKVVPVGDVVFRLFFVHQHRDPQEGSLPTTGNLLHPARQPGLAAGNALFPTRQPA